MVNVILEEKYLQQLQWNDGYMIYYKQVLISCHIFQIICYWIDNMGLKYFFMEWNSLTTIYLDIFENIFLNGDKKLKSKKNYKHMMFY